MLCLPATSDHTFGHGEARQGDEVACLMKQNGLSAIEFSAEGSALLCGGCCVQLIDDP